MQTHFLLPPNLPRQALVSPDLHCFCSRIKFKSFQKPERDETGGPSHRFDQRGKLKELGWCSQKSPLFLHVCHRQAWDHRDNCWKNTWMENFQPPELQDQRGEMFSDVSGTLQRRISSLAGNLWSKVACWSHLTWQSSESQLSYLLTESSRKVLVKTSTWTLHSTAPTQKLPTDQCSEGNPSNWIAPTMLP